MVAERKAEISGTNENYPTSAVRLVIERGNGRSANLLFEKKRSKDLYDRDIESWDLPMAITEDQEPKATLNFLVHKLSESKSIEHKLIWESGPVLRFFRGQPSQFAVQRFYRVTGVPINIDENFRLMTAAEALKPEYGLPEVTRQFLQEKYLGGDK